VPTSIGALEQGDRSDHSAACWGPAAIQQALIRGTGRLAGIPGVLIHGRLDLGGPLDTAWELARAWPDAEPHIVSDAGHTGSSTMNQLPYAAFARFVESAA
jgi:proline iminopeptidase